MQDKEDKTSDVGWMGFEQPGLMKGVSVHGRGVGN